MAEKYAKLVQDMYESCMIVVRCTAELTDGFNLMVRPHQGLALSLFLLAILMD